VAPVARLTWNNQVLDVTELSVTRALGTGLPAQVAGVSGMVAATGSATVSTKTLDVTEGLHLPWETAGPTVGDSAILATGLVDEFGNEVRSRMLSGRIDGTDGDVTDPTVGVQLIDQIDDFNVPFSMDALHYMQPSQVADAEPLMLGLHPTYLTDRLARHCGYYSTPPLHPGAIFSAPMMGSAWPERGTAVLAAPTADTTGGTPPPYPRYMSTPWGLAVANITTRLRNVDGLYGKIDRPFFVHFLVSPQNTDGRARVEVEWPDVNGATLRVRFTPTELNVYLWSYATQRDDETTYAGRAVFPLSAAVQAEVQAQGAEISAWIHPDGRIVLRINGHEHTTTGQTIPNAMKTEHAYHARFYSAGDGAYLGGVQVGTSTTQTDLHAWTRNALIETNPDGQLDALPARSNETALDILKDQASGELAAMWLDEDGTFRYRSYDRLLAQPPSQTITLDGIEGIQWSVDWDSVHERVQVTYQAPSASRARLPTATAWEGSGTTLDTGDVYEEIISIPDDEEWLHVWPLRTLTDSTSDLNLFNKGQGSWVGGAIESDTDSIAAGLSRFSSAKLEKIDPRTWKFSMTADNLEGRQLVLRTPEWTLLRASKRSLKLPVLRALAVLMWSDRDLLSTITGPTGRGTYVHDAGRWVQRTSNAQDLADDLAQFMTQPTPVMNSVPVQPDDRRQLADVVLVDLGTLVLRCLVVSIQDSLSSNDGAPTRNQTLTLQVIRTEP